MSPPRQILPGATSFVTRSCTQQQFLLLPSQVVNQIILYCAALAVRESGVLLHGICAMSNHLHELLTDPEATLPEFSYVFHKYVSKCINALRGHSENVFAGSAQPSYVRLESPAAVLEKMVYLATNPVKAGLVGSHRRWPGVVLWKPGTYRVRRPAIFFDEEGCLPESIDLEIVPPPIGGAPSRREVVEILGAAIDEAERAFRAERKSAGKNFLGVERIRRENPFASPVKRAVRAGGLSPRVATRDRWLRMEALQRLTAFASDYRAALEAWRRGDRDVVFPYGAYKMRVEHRVRCAEP